MLKLCRLSLCSLASIDIKARLAHYLPLVLFLSCLGILIIYRPNPLLAQDWSNDKITSEVVGKILESNPSISADNFSLRSRSFFRYTRRPNFWAACLIPIGYLPLSFKVSADCETLVKVFFRDRTKVFMAKASKTRIVWGRAPNPARPTEDIDYEYLKAEARYQAAENLAIQISEWLKNETE